MKIFVLMGQRKENYPGEFAPEVLACIDEVGQDNNPDYLDGEKVKCDVSRDFERTEIIALTADTKAIMARLRPTGISIEATVS